MKILGSEVWAFDTNSNKIATAHNSKIKKRRKENQRGNSADLTRSYTVTYTISLPQKTKDLMKGIYFQQDPCSLSSSDYKNEVLIPVVEMNQTQT